MATYVSMRISIILVSVAIGLASGQGYTRCPEKQYFEAAVDRCVPCEKLCFQSDLQDTTERCRKLCGAYLDTIPSTTKATISLKRDVTSTATTTTTTSSTPPPTSTAQSSTPAPKNSSSGSRSFRIAIIVVLVSVGVVVLALILWKKRKRLFKRCPPNTPKPAEMPLQPTTHPQQVSPTQAVIPQSTDGADELCVGTKQPLIQQPNGATTSYSPTSDSEETTLMVSGASGGGRNDIDVRDSFRLESETQ